MMPGNAFSLLLNGVDELGLGVNRSLPGGIVVRLQADKIFVVEKPDRIGAVVWTTKLVGDGGDLRKPKQDVSHLRPELRGLIERNRIRHRRTNPQRAFVKMRHEFRADVRNQQQRSAKERQAYRNGHFGVSKTGIQLPVIGLLQTLVDADLRFFQVLPQEERAEDREQRQRAEERSDERERHRVGHRPEQAA